MRVECRLREQAPYAYRVHDHFILHGEVRFSLGITDRTERGMKWVGRSCCIA